MKTLRALPLMVLALGLNLPLLQAAEQSREDPLKVARSVISADRQTVVKEALQLTAEESEKFWPLYDQYRAQMDKLADGLVRVVKQYANAYPNIPDDSI